MTLKRDAALEEAASLLCSRDTDALIDDDVRRAATLSDGVIFGVLENDEEAAAQNARALAAKHGLTHMGAVTMARPSGKLCRAAVLSRRVLETKSALVLSLDAQQKASYEFALTNIGALSDLDLYVSLPSGGVQKREVSLTTSPQGTQVVRFDIDYIRNGRHRIELLGKGAQGPEVAALFAVDVGTPMSVPVPDVLYPDLGHDDEALTRRTDALVHRLRNELHASWVRVSPDLERLAKKRALSIAKEKALGHLIPDDQDALSALKQDAPKFNVARLAEVQAQGATLKDAWGALLKSPAHRYELLLSGMTHMASAVVQGEDALLRPQVSVVILMARQVLDAPERAVKGALYQKINFARVDKKREPLVWHKKLAALAQRQAEAMAKARSKDDGLLGQEVSAIALSENENFQSVRSVFAIVDDPTRIASSSATSDENLAHVGIGLVSGKRAGQWHVCVLTAQ